MFSECLPQAIFNVFFLILKTPGRGLEPAVSSIFLVKKQAPKGQVTSHTLSGRVGIGRLFCVPIHLISSLHQAAFHVGT